MVGSSSFMRLQSSCWLGLLSSEGLTGAEGFASKLGHVGRKSQLLTTWASLQGCSQYGSCLPPEKVIQEQSRQDKTTLPFYDPVCKIAHHYFCYILSVKSKSLSPAYTQEVENWASLLEGKSVKEFVDKLKQPHPITQKTFAPKIQCGLIFFIMRGRQSKHYHFHFPDGDTDMLRA